MHDMHGGAAAQAKDRLVRSRILVVDDNADTRDILETLLSRQGAVVATAVGGEQGLVKFGDVRPDLVVLDLMMPDLDGFEVCRRIKAMPEGRSVPILFLTASERAPDAVTGLEAGADGYVTKPFDPHELIARVRALLRSKSLRDEMSGWVRAQHDETLRYSRLQRYLPPPLVQRVIDAVDDLALPPRRKELSLLFCDIRNFTAMSDQMDPEDIAMVLSEILESLTSAIAESGGTVVKILGDGVLAVFNDPVDQPDHVERAIRTSLALCERARSLQARLHHRLPETLAVGIGVHTGEAVVGSLQSGRMLDYTVVGSAVNLAARVQGLARRNEVVATSAVLERLGERLSFADERREVLRGYAHAIRVARVVSLA